MPWKENNDNDGPWGKPNGDGDYKTSKKKNKMNFDSYLTSLGDQFKKEVYGWK